MGPRRTAPTGSGTGWPDPHVTLPYEPSRTGLLLVAGGGCLALLPAGVVGGGLPVLAGAVGIVIALGGVWYNSIRLSVLGALGLYTSVLLAGMQGSGAVSLVVGALGAVVAWDSADNGIVMRRQLRSATTRRTEVVHAAGTVVVVLGAGIAGILFSLVVPPGTVAILVVLLVATLALVAVLTQ